MIKYILIIILLFFSIKSFCQEAKLSEIITGIAEELASDESDPEATALFIEQLHDLNDEPVNINSTDKTELSRLFFLTEFQIKALADYTRHSGKIVSPFEIANIPGFDRETAEMMIPFITLENRMNSFADSAIFRSSLLSNFSVKSSDYDTIAPGSPIKFLTKYKFTSGNISGGFTAEKDQGEKLIYGYPPQPDFLSANLSISGNRFVRRIIIGDYSARFGQGTNINTGIRTRLSLTTPGYMSGRDEIKPYTSSDENNFFRGVATQFQINNLGLSVFYSINKIDATLNSADSISNDYIESFYRSGLHNTSSSLLKKDVAAETTYGANLSYSFSTLKIGITFSESRFSLPVNITGNNPDEIYDFRGDKNQAATFYYSWLIKKMILAGEFSSDERNKSAIVQGITFKPADRLIINILYRNSQPGYRSFHSNGPGSSSSGDNMKGLLAGFTFEAAKYLFISAGCDLQHFPWLKYRCSAPSLAKREEVKIKYIPSERFSAELYFFERFSILDKQECSGIKKQEEVISKAIKCVAKYSPSENLTLSTRFDYKVVDPSGTKGMLLLQDLNYRFRTVPISLWFRYCIFKTSDWDSRLYTWENDLLYSFSIPALSGEGSRSYLVAGWKIWDGAELRVKYGITTMTDDKDVLKNTEELRMQLRLRF